MCMLATNAAVFRLLKVCLLFAGSAFALNGGPLEDALEAYVGRWVGHFTIFSAATGYSETFPVEQTYWMVDGELRGIAVSQRDSGMESSRSVSFVLEDKLISEITTGQKTERFLGVLHDNGVVWLPADIDRANDYQVKESLVAESGVMHLKTEGFDTYLYQGGLAHLVFRGDLVLAQD